MKIVSKINIKTICLYLGLFAVIFFVKCGLNALIIEVPESGNANEVSTFLLNSSTDAVINNNDDDPTYTTKLLVGFLVPKSWNAAKNTHVSFTSGKGNGVMALIPASEREGASGLNWQEAAKKRFGIGPNLLDDMEWLVYRSAENYTFVNGGNTDFQVTIKSKLGPENMLVRLGFFIGSSKENLRPEDTDYTKFAYSEPFSVLNGEGDLIDFVNPQLGTVAPVKSLDNDIITLTFDSGITDTELSGNNDLYLCVKAIMEDGEVIEICEQSDRTKLTPIGNKKYRIDFWPRGYFDVSKDKKIVQLEYFYTDVSGTKKVGYGNTSDPFKYTFKCD